LKWHYLLCPGLAQDIGVGVAWGRFIKQKRTRAKIRYAFYKRWEQRFLIS
jgi:hypothetical protein